jgi:CrcB protein
MSLAVVLLLIAAGGLGAVCRFVVDGVVRSRSGAAFPLGTLVINISGSLVLGLVTGLTVAQLLPDAVRLVVGTGFLGGYTTFSTASFETVRLVQERRLPAALLYGLGTLVATTAVAGLGLVIGLSISPA